MTTRISGLSQKEYQRQLRAGAYGKRGRIDRAFLAWAIDNFDSRDEWRESVQKVDLPDEDAPENQEFLAYIKAHEDAFQYMESQIGLAKSKGIKSFFLAGRLVTVPDEATTTHISEDC